jgi:membrane-bound lytic murein transglycosylase D
MLLQRQGLLPGQELTEGALEPDRELFLPALSQFGGVVSTHNLLIEQAAAIQDGNDTQVCYYFPLRNQDPESFKNAMPYSRPRLLMVNALFACLLSACQTLPMFNEQAQPDETQAFVAEIPQLATLESAPPLGLVNLEQEILATLASTATFTNDIWDRLRDGFSLNLAPHAKVERELEWFRKHPEYIERIQERAEPYLHFILNEIEQRQMPTEIALLPAVESAFQPFAYSPGRAAGIWQFIPSTGKHFGLKQNWWYDGRRDVVASTRAALDYLQRLSNQFDGDWELALASYNSGGGTVRRAIRRNQKKGKPTDYWSLNLPRETSDYVPRLLALSRIFATPEEYGISLQPIPDEAYFKTIDIESQLDLALAAEMAELPIQDLYRLNPGFNRWATDPDGPHRLNLPLEHVERFQQQLSQLPDEKRLTWKRYRIGSGDSLSTIAKKHGTTVALLKQVNKLSGSRIRAGKHLLIPVSSKGLDHYALSADQRKSRTQNRKRSGSKQHYVVKKGDSLWTIARQHNVSHKQLAKWNAMAPGDPIRPGQRLVLWLKEAKASPVSKLDIQPEGIQSSLSYRVRQGDSLSRIASRFKVSVNDLKRWNDLSNKYLQPGQRIRLYVDVTEQTL